VKTKQQAKLLPDKPKRKKEPRTVIVSFRLRATEARALHADLMAVPAAGVKSLKQYARKLTIDYARNRLVYVNPRDRLIDSDARDQLIVAPQNCLFTDRRARRFLGHLRSLLLDPMNWSKLRFFMLVTGWPEKHSSTYRKATTDHERAKVARAFIDEMIDKL
jgi:hypothetical protein